MKSADIELGDIYVGMLYEDVQGRASNIATQQPNTPPQPQVSSQPKQTDSQQVVPQVKQLIGKFATDFVALCQPLAVSINQQTVVTSLNKLLGPMMVPSKQKPAPAPAPTQAPTQALQQ